VQTLRHNVLDYVRKHELLKAGDRVGIAVSGGADSVALLCLLVELRKDIGSILSVVHFNHRLRGTNADDDERFVADLAQRHKLELHCGSGEVSAYATEKHLSLETAAREMRYQYFRQLLREGGLNRIATGHTLDDQAETVLLKIIRGAGGRGLAGIYPKLSVGSCQLSAVSSQQISIIRPLLGTRRAELEAYLRSLGQSWCEDKSNRDLRHMRNRVRHGILPRLERNFNPGVREALAETAEIARAEEEYWEKEVARVLPLVWQADGTIGVLKAAPLTHLPLALQRRVVRAATECLGLRLDFRHVEEIIAQSSNRIATTVLPGGWMVQLEKDALRFATQRGKPEKLEYEYRLSVPGSVEVPETTSRFEAVSVSGNAAEGYNPEDLLDRALLAAELKVRNWHPGDRFWPAHTKAAKKIKELLQDRQVTGRERKLWPVIVSGQEVVWVRGFPAPARFRPDNADNKAVQIRETALNRVDF
jgi:tRNA(Ile)-lysidine synthase